MHEKRFGGDITRLRNPERIARLDVDWVVSLSLEGGSIKTVLDVGTGTGVFAEAFARRIGIVLGVDVNSEMLTAARIYVLAGSFSIATAENLPCADASVDLVFMGLLLHESDDQTQVLREARRVARTQVGILEWAYRIEDFGAPLEQRLPAQALRKMSMEIGYSKFEEIPLTKLIFYRLSV